MIDNHFRKVMPRFVEPLVVQISKLGIRPNHITIFAFIISASAGYFVVSGQFILAAMIWWVGRFFDGLDGILARATQSTSEFGAYLDILLDMAAYSLFIVALSVKFPELNINWNITLFLYVLCITSALSFGSLNQNKSNDDNRGLQFGAGLAEAGETGIAYTLFMIFPHWINVLSLVWIGILVFTVITRTILAYKVLR